MAPGFKTGGRNIQKGQVLNPHGRPRSDACNQKLKDALARDIREWANEMMRLPYEKLEDIADIKKVNKNPSIRILIARVVLRALKEGDPSRLNVLLERVLGRVKETHEHDINFPKEAPKLVLEIIDNESKALQDVSPDPRT